ARHCDERRLPGAGARRRVDDDRMPRLENAFHAGQDFLAKDRELRPAMVDGGQAESAQHPIRHRARPRDLQEMAATRMLVERDHEISRKKPFLHAKTTCPWLASFRFRLRSCTSRRARACAS